MPEWVQIAMAKLIGMIRDQESRVTTFCFTLYCADTGQNTGRKTFAKEFFFIGRSKQVAEVVIYSFVLFPARSHVNYVNRKCLFLWLASFWGQKTVILANQL